MCLGYPLVVETTAVTKALLNPNHTAHLYTDPHVPREDMFVKGCNGSTVINLRLVTSSDLRIPNYQVDDFCYEKKHCGGTM